MAELVLKVGDGASYEDGDVLCAFNDRRIGEVHLHHIGNPALRPDISPRAGGRKNGLIQADTIAEHLKRKTSQFMFQRVSRRAVLRTNLLTDEQVQIDRNPRLIDGRMQHMFVEEFVARRMRSARHGLFGTEGREFWFGKVRSISAMDITDLWLRVEGETDLRRADHRRFPLTERERKVHLPIAFQDFDEAEAAEFVAPLMDEADATNMVAKRARKIEYDAIYPDRIENIRDTSKVEDLRDLSQRRKSEIVVKSTVAEAPKLS